MKLGVALRLLLFAAVAVHLWFLGLAQLTSTLNLLEAEWTLVALVGSAYSAAFLRDAALDVRAAVGSDQVTRLFAEILLLVGAVLLTAHLILLGIGVIAATTPPPVYTANLNASRMTGTGFTLMAIAMVLTLVAIRQRRGRIVRLTSGPRLNGSADSAIVGASR